MAITTIAPEVFTTPAEDHNEYRRLVGVATRKQAGAFLNELADRGVNLDDLEYDICVGNKDECRLEETGYVIEVDYDYMIKSQGKVSCGVIEEAAHVAISYTKSPVYLESESVRKVWNRYLEQGYKFNLQAIRTMGKGLVLANYVEFIAKLITLDYLRETDITEAVRYIKDEMDVNQQVDNKWIYAFCRLNTCL